MKFGVVVVAYHSTERLIRFIKDEVPKLGQDVVVAIVNNDASESESADLASRCGAVYMKDARETPPKDFSCFMLSFRENLGYAKGNNRGAAFLMRNFAPRYLLFSNDDIVVQTTDILEKLAVALEMFPRGKMIGPRVVTPAGVEQSPHRRKISLYRQIGWNLFPYLRRKKSSERTDVRRQSSKCELCYWVSGAFLLTDAEAFRECGGFDEATFLYCEEMILAERMLKHDWRCVFFPEAAVLHEDGASSRALSSRQHEILLASSCYYYRKYCNRSAWEVALFRWASRLHQGFRRQP